MAKGSHKRRRTMRTKQEDGLPRVVSDKGFQPEPIRAKNTFQKNLFKSLNEKQVVVVNSPAGTGKTYVCMGQTSDWFKKGEVDEVIITRPSVGMGRTLGLLKGDLQDKFDPYIAPMKEVFTERWGRGAWDTALSSGNIKCVPFEYMRGRNIRGVCILDEAQNATPDELYCLLTRIAETGKLIIIGDSTQNDLKTKNGLEWLERFTEQEGLEDYVSFHYGTSDDIVRSGLCKAVVKAKESVGGTLYE